jgi:DNA mismatch endonuclease Vsr
MSQIKGKNTKPEILVRSLLHQMGYRFRLHAKNLPGRPDFVLPKYKTAIFVHGCSGTNNDIAGAKFLESSDKIFYLHSSAAKICFQNGS